jgi:hypothetical protein
MSALTALSRRAEIHPDDVVCGAFSSLQHKASSVIPCLDDINHRPRNGIVILRFIGPINYAL